MTPPVPIARLITIPFSHYCEKARWALERAGVAFVEDAYLPMMHLVPMRRAGGKTVPVVVADGRVYADSADIVAYADGRAPAERKLYPTDADARREVDAIEAEANAKFGRATRLFAYHHGLPRASVLADMVRPGLTRLQALVMPALVPLAGVLIRRAYRIDDASAARAQATVRRVFSDFSKRLEGKRYFLGDRFTAADLTFAALAAPVVLPEGHPAMASRLDGLAPEHRALVEELRATPAGAHVTRMYREERREAPVRSAERPAVTNA
jgi:glutathione S-transferase